MVEIKNKLNLSKIGNLKMRDIPKRGPPKFKIFNLLSWTYEIFEVTKHQRWSPQGHILKSSKIALSSARGQHYFLKG